MIVTRTVQSVTRRQWMAGFLLTGSCLWAAPESDDSIYDQVRLRLAGEPEVNGGAIAVEVKEAVVTLRGKVRTDKAKERATRITKKVKGVKSVDNQLVVDPNAH
ncbi:MAG: BON domain-containing protein [Bryobacteraceae bacterium]